MSYGDPPPPPSDPYGGAPAYGAAQAKTSGKAIASLVTGIFGALTFCCGFLVVPGIVALVLGILARREIAASGGQLKGDGMALAGVILGVVSIVSLVVLIILYATGAVHADFNRT